MFQKFSYITLFATFQWELVETVTPSISSQHGLTKKTESILNPGYLYQIALLVPNCGCIWLIRFTIGRGKILLVAVLHFLILQQIKFNFRIVCLLSQIHIRRSFSPFCISSSFFSRFRHCWCWSSAIAVSLYLQLAACYTVLKCDPPVCVIQFQQVAFGITRTTATLKRMPTDHYVKRR